MRSYKLKHTKTGRDITVWFNYMTPDLDEASSFLPGFYYCAWVEFKDEPEYVHECEELVEYELTNEEKELFVRNYFRKLYMAGWVMHEIIDF